ncbi:MAG: Fic family protein [Verrucomicrobia bacterium]|nr:Fic family protein [Verrucomicrobiota bacterium]
MKLPQPPPDPAGLLNRLADAAPGDEILSVFAGKWEVPGRYLHWDNLRHREPPKGLTVEEWWLRIRLNRNSGMQPIPLLDLSGTAFGYGVPEFIQRRIHEIDFGGGGFKSVRGQNPDAGTSERYLVKSLISEAITSSQLEGAATTRQVAKEMLQSGRPPRDRHEQMIANNYRTMQRIVEIHQEPMTPRLVCELHRLVTEDTLGNPAKAGRLRVATDQVQVTTTDESVILHDPPPATELKARMKAMCDFANGKSPSSFIPPVVCAILLHFWLAYDHPFVDGNGRTARALFYWAMLNRGYWLLEFISISEIILKAPSRYARSFLYAESDANDLTYFLDHQTQVIMRAIQELHEYIGHKKQEAREAAARLGKLGRYNIRQVALLLHAQKNRRQVYTVHSHKTCHRVTTQTARTDLEELHRHRLLNRGKHGRAFTYTPAAGLEKKLRAGDH